MLQLTKEQLEFLDHHKIPLSSVFDATGLAKKDYRPLMKNLDKAIAIGVTPCRKEGHVLRLRTGHCVICNPQALAHFHRHHKNSYVYVAASKNGRKLKVGFTKDISVREDSLNRTNYANFTDWKIIYYIHCENAGKIESEIQKKLSAFYSPGEYQKEGRTVACYELFQCDYKTVKDKIDEIKIEFSSENFQLENEIKDAISKYNFSSIVNESHKRVGNDDNTQNIHIQKNIKTKEELGDFTTQLQNEEINLSPPLLEKNESEKSSLVPKNRTATDSIGIEEENKVVTNENEYSEPKPTSSTNEGATSLNEKRNSNKSVIKIFIVIALIILALYLLLK